MLYFCTVVCIVNNNGKKL
ncbi:hypothetical protein [Escherichia coli]